MSTDSSKDFQIVSTGKYTLEFFPQEFIDLNGELCSGYHPKLEDILARYPADEIDIKLAHIASYCEVMLDGAYDIDARRQLCEILRQKLMLLRETPKGQIVIAS